MMKRHFKLSAACTFTVCTLSTGTALGAVSLPGGDIWLSGEFDEINYGETGLAYIKPFLYVGDLAATDSPGSHATVTNLDYSYQFSGEGTSMMKISYVIKNMDPAAFTDLRFFVDVQADGSDSFNDIAKLTWPTKGANDPDHFQVVDWLSVDLPTEIVFSNRLNDTNACGNAVCDVDFGLQWNLASLDPGQTWQITLGLSDDGSSLSGRMLQAISADTANTILTASGTATATVVPLPASAILMTTGLLGLAGMGRRPRLPSANHSDS